VLAVLCGRRLTKHGVASQPRWRHHQIQQIALNIRAPFNTDTAVTGYIYRFPRISCVTFLPGWSLRSNSPCWSGRSWHARRASLSLRPLLSFTSAKRARAGRLLATALFQVLLQRQTHCRFIRRLGTANGIPRSQATARQQNDDANTTLQHCNRSLDTPRRERVKYDAIANGRTGNARR
jgi:hypothetical protein